MFGGLNQLCINFNKKLFGYMLGDFFTNSSGRPEHHVVLRRQH
jgi:hypothetical protein